MPDLFDPITDDSNASHLYVAAAPKRSRNTRACPSPWWIEQIKSGRIRRFPIPADHTPMVGCRSGEKRCGLSNPFYYGRMISRRRRWSWWCDDCIQAMLWEQRLAFIQREYPSDDRDEQENDTTPFQAALAYLRDTGQRLVELELEPEDETSLKREIQAHKPQ